MRKHNCVKVIYEVEMLLFQYIKIASKNKSWASSMSHYKLDLATKEQGGGFILFEHNNAIFGSSLTITSLGHNDKGHKVVTLGALGWYIGGMT